MQIRASMIEKAEQGRINWVQAAQVMGITTRQLRRIRKRYADKGRAGLADGRKTRVRKKRISEAMARRMCELKAGPYEDFSVKHFYDVAAEQYGLEASYDWLRQVLISAGVVQKATRRGTYRRRRERQPMVGMRVHTDGSTHAWLGEDKPRWDLVIMLDDADGRLLAARFVPQEGVLSTLMLLWDVLTKYGRFAELYHDRGSMYCQTSDATVGPDVEQSGQIPRVLRALSIGQRWAYSPQARGRCERAFGTIQGRLCAALRHAGITDYAAADAYVQAVFIPEFNRRFTVVAKEPESAFVPLGMTQQALRQVLSAQYNRRVNNDYTVQFKRRRLQLAKTATVVGLCGKQVTVHRFWDETLGISYGGKMLSYYEDEEPTRRPVEQRRYLPLPSLPDSYCRQGVDLTDPNFWSFLNTATKASVVVQRGDLYAPSW